MKKIILAVLMTFFLFSSALAEKMTITVFTSPKNVYVDGVVVKGVKDFEYLTKKHVEVAEGSSDELMIAYEGAVIKGTIALDALSPVLDEHLKAGSTFNIDYFEAEKEGSNVNKIAFSGCKLVKSYFSFEGADKTVAKYVFKAKGVSMQ